MIDLETLGTQPGSIILSIGAVLFDPTLPPESCTGEEFYCVVNQESSLDHAMTLSQDTLDWWMKQSPEARQVLNDSNNLEKSDSLPDALRMLASFIPDGAKVWSNGANFDQPILDVAYNRCDIALPWKFWNSRCYRTILALYPHEKAIRPPTVCAHNALEDAKWQALHMTGVAQALKLNLK
jgi:hypothetical protein